MCVTDLLLVFHQGDLTVDTASFFSTNRLQFIFVEGKQLGTSQDPQTINRPAEKQSDNSFTFFDTWFIALLHSAYFFKGYAATYLIFSYLILT